MGAARIYPCVPGHEIVGRVDAVGARGEEVQGRRPAGVGCMVDSCRTCANCQRRPRAILRARLRRHLQRPEHGTGEQHLRRLFRADRRRRALRAAHPRRASTSPAPRRCSAPASPPIRRCATGRSGPGKKVGIVGLGGLGHMGVKFAARAWARMSSLFTTSPEQGRRRASARRRRGAWSRSDADAMATHAGSFDFILDTVAAPATTSTPISDLLKRDGDHDAGRRAGDAASLARRRSA